MSSQNWIAIANVNGSKNENASESESVRARVKGVVNDAARAYLRARLVGTCVLAREYVAVELARLGELRHQVFQALHSSERVPE